MPRDASYATHSCLCMHTHTQTHTHTHTHTQKHKFFQLMLHYISITHCHLRSQFRLASQVSWLSHGWVCLHMCTHTHTHTHSNITTRLATHLSLMDEAPVETHQWHRLEECQRIIKLTHEGGIYLDRMLMNNLWMTLW